MCPLKYRQQICSPSFVVGILGGTRWKLILYPKGFYDPDYMSIYLLREPCHRKIGIISVDLEFTLKTTHVQRKKVLYDVSFMEGKCHGERRLLRIMYRNGNYIFSCKQICVTCRIICRDDTSSHNNLDLLLLSNHLLLLLKSGHLADLAVCCQKREFLVHTAILKARCPNIFNSLDFDSSSLPKRARIKKFKLPVFRSLLEYIYTGRIAVSVNNLRAKLYEAAHRLEMKDLIETMDSLPDIFSLKTIFNVEKCYFTWPISKSHVKEEESLTRILHFNTMYFHDLIMTLRIDTNPENIQTRLSIYFRINNFDEYRPIFLWYKIFLKDIIGNKLQCIHRKNAFRNDGTWFGDGSFDIGLITGEFLLECQIEVSDERCTSTVKTIIDDSSFNTIYNYNTVQLSRDMKLLLESGKFSDVTIQCKDQTFAVHRAFLEVRFSFFRKLFKQFKSRNGCVKINSVSPCLLSYLILYTYSGTIKPLQRKEMIHLRRFANALNAKALEQKCVSFLYGENEFSPLHGNLGG
ncbi:speckle-type POZ protein B [Nephila pilipes]|uniref:Speckle-type POZ protein B n=1 Tax=Nephila pilipes TaxID=299642 RepID=A0A8X6PKW2_NEPPI|nr:speckle-type POZ protein B [Nephila pilipes]